MQFNHYLLQYDIDGKLINTFKNKKNVLDKFFQLYNKKLNYYNLYRCCTLNGSTNIKHKYHGYYWVWGKFFIIPPSTIKIKKKKYTIIQYDMFNGNFIKEYRTYDEAANELKIQKQYIIKCCNGIHKTVDKKYICTKRFEDEKLIEQLNIKEYFKYVPQKNIKLSKIYQFTRDKKYIATFDCVKDVNVITNIDKRRIIGCINGYQPTAKGFIFWRIQCI